MPGLAHLYIGEEAVAVGVCEALRRDDYITSTHRGHGHCLAKGAAVDRMFCELLGKEAGYCRGKGGSMHIADQENGNLGANAIVGGSAGIATGAAFATSGGAPTRSRSASSARARSARACSTRSMNMAPLWKLPVIYVCENNLYNEYTHHSETTAGDDRGARRGVRDPGRGSRRAGCARGLRRGAARWSSVRGAARGPAFLLCHTYRYHGHHVGDIDRAYYRSKDEEERLEAERDPLNLLGELVARAGPGGRRRARRRSKTMCEAEVDGRRRVRARRAVPRARGGEQDVYA